MAKHKSPILCLVREPNEDQISIGENEIYYRRETYMSKFNMASLLRIEFQIECLKIFNKLDLMDLIEG